MENNKKKANITINFIQTLFSIIFTNFKNSKIESNNIYFYNVRSIRFSTRFR
jgi:hypothetical protein